MWLADTLAATGTYPTTTITTSASSPNLISTTATTTTSVFPSSAVLITQQDGDESVGMFRAGSSDGRGGMDGETSIGNQVAGLESAARTYTLPQALGVLHMDGLDVLRWCCHRGGFK